MATAAQIEANRRNAQRSTGPKTNEGKARVRRNAITHGMTARTIMPVLPQEDPKVLDDRTQQAITAMKPRNPLELDLVRRAVRLSGELDCAERVATAHLAHRVRMAARSGPETVSATSSRRFTNSCTFPEVGHLVRRPGRWWALQMRRLSPHAVVGYGHRVMRRRVVDGVAMAAGIARRLDHRPGRDARRPPAGAVRATLHRAALRPRSPHRHQLAARLRHGVRLQTLLLPARQRGTQDPSDRQSLAPHPPQATPRRWCGYAVGLRHRRLPHQAVRAAR